VDRYIEKPWQDGLPVDTAKALLRGFARSAHALRHYEFAELRSREALRAALELRYEVYLRTPALVKVLPEDGGMHMDADSYDRFARHFGLVRHDADESRLCGSIRVVKASRSGGADHLESLLPEGTPLGERLRPPRRNRLPMLSYLVDGPSVERLLAELDEADEQAVEPSRLVLLPESREGGAAGERHLARHMIEGSVAFFFFFFRIMNALLTCVPTHAAFYRPYGFREAKGTRTQLAPALGTEVSCLHGRIDGVPAKAAVRCGELASHIAQIGGGGVFVDARPSPRASGVLTAAAIFPGSTCGAQHWRWTGSRWKKKPRPDSRRAAA
jgi:hypothetical protein